MDWNTKWDWENLVSFNTKTVENPKQQMTNWGIEEGITGTGSVRLYKGKGSSSGSEVAAGSSARSPISVCTDSTIKEVMKNTQVAFGNINAFFGDFCEKEDLDESPLTLESSVGSGEPMIGLRLGKRMYFENNGIAGNPKTVSLGEIPNSSMVKKIKTSNPVTPSRCQVEGCNVDLSSAKEYHRKHKVCASHSKCPKVFVKGLERRFCQQCSRFHSLLEFDENKKSCRKRLSDHNTRRRKPQLDPIQFNTMRLPSPFSAFTSTNGGRQMSLVSNNTPHYNSRSSSESTWGNTFSQFTNTKGVLLNFGNTEGIDKHMQLAGTLTLPDHDSNRLFSCKGTKSETFTRGFKDPIVPPNSGSAPDFHRAPSLLSNDSWGSYPQSNSSLARMHHQPLMHGFPQCFPQTSSEFCRTDPHSTDNLHNGHFQLFKAPCEDVLHSNLFN